MLRSLGYILLSALLGGCLSQSRALLVCPSPSIETDRPLAVASAAPSEEPKPEDLKKLPYALPSGPDSLFFLYHLAEGNVFLYPGAGKGLRNISELEPDRYLFDRGGKIFLYDPAKELLCRYPEANAAGRYAFRPSFDSKENLFFLVTDDPKCFEKELGNVAYLPVGDNCSPILLEKINTVGRMHGGIDSFAITSNGGFLSFATEDGGIYLSTLRGFEVTSLCLLLQRKEAKNITLDPIWGRWLAWEEARIEEIFLYDRFESCLIPLLDRASSPSFYGSDPFHLFFLVSGEDRVNSFDIRCWQIRDLTLLNLAARDFLAVFDREGGLK